MTDFQPERGFEAADRGVDMIRSEERAHIDLTLRETGRVRIAKRVVTEDKTITVTVRREVLVVEELPAHGDAPLDLQGPTPAGAAGPVAERSPAERPSALEIVLHEEQVRTTTVVVPVERVRVVVDTVDGAREVTADLAHEVVTLETSPSAASTQPAGLATRPVEV